MGPYPVQPGMAPHPYYNHPAAHIGGPAHMGGPSGHPGYSYPSLMSGPGNSHAMNPSEALYRPGPGYFGYPQQPEGHNSHMYGYGASFGNGTSQNMPMRSLSVAGEDSNSSLSMSGGTYSIAGLNRLNSSGSLANGQGYPAGNVPLSASPPGSDGYWNKSSPRSKRAKQMGKSPHGSEPSLSSSTEDLLSLVGKPHLIKDYTTTTPSGSLEFSGSMTDLPNMASPAPHSPRSPGLNRKQIKVQQRTGSGPGTTKPAGAQSAGYFTEGEGRPISQPMPIGWATSPGVGNGDDFSNLLGSVQIGTGGNQGGINSHPEFVLGSGSPVMPHRMHSAGNAAPGSNPAGQQQLICHYYTMGMCGKGDKCRYLHVEAGEGDQQRTGGRRTPRAPSGATPGAPVSANATSNASLSANNGYVDMNTPLISSSGLLQPGPAGILGQSPAHMASSLSPLLTPLPTSPNASLAQNASPPGANAASAAAALNAPTRYSNTTLEECIGQIFQMCKDQYGCRFLQKKLDEDKTSTTCDVIFGEILPEIVELMSDPFGNYLCQKLIEKCTPQQRLAIVRGVSGSLVQISKNMHGTRAVQKTIEQLGSPEEIRLIRDALKGSVVALIQDLNGNHVIQKCIHRLEPNDNQFIYDAVAHHCVQVATHRHGCCVMQRCIDHSSTQQKMQLVEEIKNNALSLVQDQFGNYVVQYVLDLGMESVCEALAANLLGHLYFLSTQKFSSNVVEKCLKVGNANTVQMMSKELAEFQTDPEHPVFPQTPNDDPLICLLQHPFGNYVVQTALQVAQLKSPKEWNQIAARIKPLIPNLRSNTYVKRVQGLLQTPVKGESGEMQPIDQGMLTAMEPQSVGPHQTHHHSRSHGGGGGMPRTQNGQRHSKDHGRTHEHSISGGAQLQAAPTQNRNGSRHR